MNVKKLERGESVRIRYARPQIGDVFIGCAAIIISMDRRKVTQKCGGYFKIRFKEMQKHPLSGESVSVWYCHGMDLENAA